MEKKKLREREGFDFVMELIVNSCEVLNKCCKNVYFYLIKLGNIV